MGNMAKEHQADRPSWHEYFMDITRRVAARSTCTRRRVGSLLVKNKQILASGYNGAPRGVKHCAEVGCLREQLKVPSGQRHELCRGLHAEQNAIIQAAVHGVSIAGAMLYTTTYPCMVCAKMLVNAGIVHIYYDQGYPDDYASGVLAEAGIRVEHVADPGS